MWNDELEIVPEAEESIIREVFPELSAESESERGRYPGRPSQMARHSNMFSQNLRQPVHGGRGVGQHYQSRRRGPNSVYAGIGGAGRNPYSRQGGSSSNAPYGSPQWAQSALGQTVGPWVGKSGRFDPVTRRALRIFQSRNRLPVTGGLDNDTPQALLNQVNQQAQSPVDAAPPPDSAVSSDPSASAPSAATDNAPDQGPSDPASGEISEFHGPNSNCALCRSLAREYGTILHEFGG
jgi:hypothetical protein